MSAANRRTTTRTAAGAAHVIAGFRYQLLQSVRALLNLRDDEQLFLEVSEDFSIVSAASSTDVQVKHSQAASGPPGYSLQSADIEAVLARFWSAQKGKERRIVFIARGGAVREKDFEFPEKLPGLLYWRAAAIDAATAPVRNALSAIFADKPLGAWIASGPTDQELRTHLLRRVEWQLEDVATDTLTEQFGTRSGRFTRHATYRYAPPDRRFGV
jgi:hypothetical protein